MASLLYLSARVKTSKKQDVSIDQLFNYVNRNVQNVFFINKHTLQHKQRIVILHIIVFEAKSGEQCDEIK